MFIMLFLCLVLVAVESSNARVQDAKAVVAEHGMVSSAQPLATEAGLEILRNGGNAFSAAVAVAAALNVVEPMMSGMGGYGTILVYDARTKTSWFLNSSGRIPRNVDPDQFRAPTPNFKENRSGPKAVSTPGNVHAWEAMSERFGNMEWGKLFEPAIRHAENGYALNNIMARFIRFSFDTFPEHAKQFYGNNGKPLAEGELLVQKDLAKTLRRIAEEGASAFYSGAIMEAIDAEMKKTGGFLSADDLRSDKAEWWEPISIDVSGRTVVTASPPANAFDALVRIGMMSEFDLKSLGHNSLEYLHRFAEITKHGFWLRLKYAGDPDIAPPPLNTLLSRQYWKKQNERIDPVKASDFEPPIITTEQNMNTTHFVVADRWGNVVSATQTLGNLFGSRIMPPGTGFWLNNSLEYCTFEPKGNPMDAHPGRRKLSGDCPIIIFKDNKPWVALGTPGGHTIGQTVAQMVLNVIAFDMDIQQAISAPRVSFIEPNELAVEPRIAEHIREALHARGHNVTPARSLGNAHGLMIEYDSTGKPVRFLGGADPRGRGAARGY